MHAAVARECKTVRESVGLFDPGSGDIAIQPPSPQPQKTYASKQSVHTVKKGDTLYSISRNYGTTVAALRQVNGISGSLIRIGERISIP